MKQILSSVIFAGASLLAPAHAFAYMAMAAGDNDSLFIARDVATPEDARNAALQGCAQHATNCHFTSDAFYEGTALIIAKGKDGGWAAGVDRDPDAAAAQAMRDCKTVAKSCAIAMAEWDNGAVWSAIASNASRTHTAMHTGAMTRRDAEGFAVRNCQLASAPNDACSVIAGFTTSGHAYYATARDGKNAVSVGASTVSRAVAEAGALDECRKTASPADSCKITGSAENPGPKAAPASMQRYVALAEKFGK
ncbi:DUF4189 domain-containing protein [Paraburkholderia sp. SIMBA_054]|uniref:DUF4189 domain-containing protein n=1 Tax=Paraburkholderia sp. SIMBA_054 TaxID=3085795 RepID=UPI00397CD263